MCSECYHKSPEVVARKKECSREHSELYAARSRKWRKDNKDRVKEYFRLRWFSGKVKSSDFNRKNLTVTQRKNGWTVERTDKLMEDQSGQCRICTRVLLKPQRGKVFATSMVRDHDHNTSKPRALLCSTCNVVLGHYEKQLRGVLNLPPFEEYLRLFEEQENAIEDPNA